VVGASGFIGSAVSASLRSVGAALFTPTRQELVSISDRLRVALAHASDVVWLAGVASPALAARTPYIAWADVRLLQATLASRASNWPAARFTLVSSGGTVYDTSLPPPYHETSPIRPVSPYAITRVAMESELRSAWSNDDCIVRVANAYGPGQEPKHSQGVVAHWLQAAQRGDQLRLTAPSSTARDFVYIADVADAFVTACLATRRPPVVNVGSGCPTTLGELSARIVRMYPGTGLDPQPPSRSPAPIKATWLDISLAGAALGWHPRVGIDAGVAATVEAQGAERPIR